MTRTRSLASGILSFSAAAVLALTTAGGASAAPASPSPSEDALLPSVAGPAVNSAGAADYWTADRMERALPGDVLAGQSPGSAAPACQSRRSGQRRTASRQSSRQQGRRQPATGPVTHIGKVFFTMGGANYVCSGNSVTSSQQEHRVHRRPLRQRGPGRVCHQLRLRSRLRQRRRTLRQVDRQGPLHPHPVELPAATCPTTPASP